MKKSIGEFVLVNPQDIPTVAELKETAERLRKDAKSMIDCCRKDSAKTFNDVAHFLESLIEREGDRLRKGKTNEGDNS